MDEITISRIDCLLKFTCINSLGNLENLIAASKALGRTPKKIVVPKIKILNLEVEFGDVSEVTLK